MPLVDSGKQIQEFPCISLEDILSSGSNIVIGNKQQQTATNGNRRLQTAYGIVTVFRLHSQKWQRSRCHTSGIGTYCRCRKNGTSTWCRCRCRFFRCRVPFIADAAFRHRFRQRHPAPLETGEPYHTVPTQQGDTWVLFIFIIYIGFIIYISLQIIGRQIINPLIRRIL